MGEMTNFLVNDDGSVTVGNKTSNDESNILDIFRIEKAKGGPFASRRMKKRARKYARQANVPEHVVEKLMLDSYPNEFANYRRTTWLIVWFIAAFLFLGGTVLFGLLTKSSYDAYSYDMERYDDILERENEYKRTGYNNDYSKNVDYIYAGERYEDALKSRKDSAERSYSEFLINLFLDIVFMAITVVCVMQYLRLRRKVIETSNKDQIISRIQ